jgi:hypothetical protein
MIASCRINGYVLLRNIQFSGIGISTSDVSATPTALNQGIRENISGRILIANNDIDAGANPIGNVLGITTFSRPGSDSRRKYRFVCYCPQSDPLPVTGSGCHRHRCV